MKTPVTRTELQAIVRRDFAGSQAEFSRACGIDFADTSRVLTGVRPASFEIVTRVAKTVAPSAATRLIEAFFSDMIAVFPQRCSVIVRPQLDPAQIADEGAGGCPRVD